MLKLTIADEASVVGLLPDPNDVSVEVWRDTEGRVCAYGKTLGQRHWMHLPGVASFSFGSLDTEVKAIACGNARADLIEDVFSRSVLPMALQVRGTEVLHASAFVAGKGVIALCAVSGTGKSTIACAMSHRGYRLWADDAVALDISGCGVRTTKLPFALRLLPDAAAFFAQRHAVPVLTGCEDDSANKQSRLAALVLLKRGDAAGGSTVEAARLAPNEAFIKVLTHAYCFNLRDSGRKRLMITNYINLTNEVPTFEVTFKEGLANLSPVLDCLKHLARQL